MYIKNREEYCKIPISALNFSTRTFNCLKRANISTLYFWWKSFELRSMKGYTLYIISRVAMLFAITVTGHIRRSQIQGNKPVYLACGIYTDVMVGIRQKYRRDFKRMREAI